MTTDYKRLRELAEKATQSWSSSVWIETDGNEWRATGPAHEENSHDHGSEPGCPDEQAAQRDAAFIAACHPQQVIALLDEIARLRALALEACDLGARLGTVRTTEIGQEYQRDHCKRLAEIRAAVGGRE